MKHEKVRGKSRVGISYIVTAVAVWALIAAALLMLIFGDSRPWLWMFR